MSFLTEGKLPLQIVEINVKHCLWCAVYYVMFCKFKMRQCFGGQCKFRTDTERDEKKKADGSIEFVRRECEVYSASSIAFCS